MKDHFQNSSIEKGDRVTQPHEYLREVESHAKKLAQLIEERELLGENEGAMTAEEAFRFSEIVGELNTAFQEGDYPGFTEKSVSLYNLISPYGRELLQKTRSADGSLGLVFSEFKAIFESLSKMNEGVSNLEGFDIENFKNMTNYVGEIVRSTDEIFGLSKKDGFEKLLGEEFETQQNPESVQEQIEPGDAVGVNSSQANGQSTLKKDEFSVNEDEEHIGVHSSVDTFGSQEIMDIEDLLESLNDGEVSQNKTVSEGDLSEEEIKKEKSISDKEKLDERARQEVMTNLARGFSSVAEAALLFQRRTIMREREGLRIQLLEPKDAIRVTLNFEEVVRALKTDDVKAATDYLMQIPQALRNFGEGRSQGSAIREDINSLRTSMYAFNDLSQSVSRIRNIYQKNEAIFEDKEFLTALRRVELSLKTASENGEIVFRKMRSVIN